jgi:hypothetical protein
MAGDRRGKGGRPRRFAPPAPKKVKKRRLERFILGGVMSLVAWFLERRILRAIKKKHPGDDLGPRAETLAAATAEQVDHERDGHRTAEST